VLGPQAKAQKLAAEPKLRAPVVLMLVLTSGLHNRIRFFNSIRDLPI
jgi:hypothetical protein